MAGPDPDATKKAQQALATVAETWMAQPGVVSVEVARRWQDGAPTDEIGIRVTVRRNQPRGDIPPSELFPSSLDGIPVDVVEGEPPSPEV
jgi:hypothetical protein